MKNMDEHFQHIDSLYIGRPLSREIVKNRWKECMNSVVSPKDFAEYADAIARGEHPSLPTVTLLCPIPEYTEEEHDIMVEEARQHFIADHGYDPMKETYPLWMYVFFIVVALLMFSISFSIFTKWFGV